MEQLTSPVDGNFTSVELVKNFKSKKKVGFLNAGTGSYSPSIMSLQLDVLEKDFKIFPNTLSGAGLPCGLAAECGYVRNAGRMPSTRGMWTLELTHTDIDAVFREGAYKHHLLVEGICKLK